MPEGSTRFHLPNAADSQILFNQSKEQFLDKVAVNLNVNASLRRRTCMVFSNSISRKLWGSTRSDVGNKMKEKVSSFAKAHHENIFDKLKRDKSIMYRIAYLRKRHGDGDASNISRFIERAQEKIRLKACRYLSNNELKWPVEASKESLTKIISNPDHFLGKLISHSESIEPQIRHFVNVTTEKGIVLAVERDDKFEQCATTLKKVEYPHKTTFKLYALSSDLRVAGVTA